MTKLLQKLSKEQKKFAASLDEMFENLLTQIRRKRAECQEKIYFNYLEKNEVESLKAIYLKDSSLSIVGDDAKDLFRKLKKVSFEVDFLGLGLLEKLEKDLK